MWGAFAFGFLSLSGCRGMAGEWGSPGRALLGLGHRSVQAEEPGAAPCQGCVPPGRFPWLCGSRNRRGAAREAPRTGEKAGGRWGQPRVGEEER